MASDEVQGERLIVNVEIGPIHGDDDLLACADSLTQGANISQTTTPRLLDSRSTCLIACLQMRPRACASEGPMIETASEALVMTPSAPLARDSIRLACRLPAKIRERKPWANSTQSIDMRLHK